MTVKVSDGTVEQDVTWTMVQTGEVEADMTVKVIPSGYKNIETMLAEPVFYVAHRGGSVTWPEGTLRAYTEAVALGAGALELSWAKTSDGVWFGLHDDSLDRTSGYVSGTTANQMTWAEVQAQQVLASITSDPTQANQPYMSFDDFAATYGQGGHVMFMDPKYRHSDSWKEFYTMLASLPSNPRDRIVAKFIAAGNTTFATRAQAAGFQTWGFFYESDITGDANIIANTHAPWTMIGMNWDASQASWDKALATGKPVIGHICATKAQASTAIAKGASGIMMSGVRSVLA